MKKLMLLILALALLTLPAWAQGETIENWAVDSPAMQSIVDFVSESVDESAPGYIPVEDRVAVFDMDGTLYGERFPTYFNDWLYINRALHDDSYQAPEELRAFAQAWEDKVLRGVPMEDFDALERELGPQLYEGLTADEYADVVRRFKAMDVWGFEGMTYGEAYFQPMVSLVKYLREHDYAVYIVSATYRDAVRVMTEGVLYEYIPYDRVIGTDLKYVASGDAARDSMFYELTSGDELVIAGELFLKNQKTNKAAMIQQEIGRVPVLAFGNSTGDFSMATYTLSNEKYAARAYMLLCDDTGRDYGDPEAAAAFQAKCEANGFYTVSERDEFAALYPAGARKMGAAEAAGYQLDRMVVLSRHNIRSPLSGGGSLLGDITPHSWFAWTSNPSELSRRGAVLETLMGQYFRLRLEQAGLFPENYQPEAGAVRFYANAKQRTLATARYFSAGLLPVAQINIESHAPYDTMDPTFEPKLHFVTEEYARDVMAQVAEKGGVAGLNGILAGLQDAIALMMDTADIEKSEAYQSGKYGDLLNGETVLSLVEGKEPGMTGPIKSATSVADAMILQYYEEADARRAAFGHDLTEADWQKIHSIVDTYSDMLFCAPLVSVNVAHPLLREIRAELTAPGRQFSFLCGHDSNVASVLAALNVEDYLLSQTVEQHTPIGVKLVFERWLNAENAAFYKVSLVYQSTEQLRSMEPLSLENPPVEAPVRFQGVPTTLEGLIAEEDLLALLDGAIDAYDALVEEYQAEAQEPAA